MVSKFEHWLQLFFNLSFTWTFFQSGGWGLVSTHSCPQFRCSKKNSNFTHFTEIYSSVSEQIKPQPPISQATEFKFESKFEPLQVIWQSIQKAIPEDNGRFDCKINGRALGAALPGLHSFGWLDGQAQTQGVSKSAAVAAGSNATKLPMCYHSCDTGSVQVFKSQ